VSSQWEMIGIFNENTWKTKTIKIKPADMLILYTDGITEAQNEAGDFYGNDRLIQSLKSGFNPSTTTFRNTILENVQAFMGSAPRLDDITLIVISREADILKD